MELISKDIWSKDKNKLLKKLDNKLLLKGINEIISNLKNELNEAYKTVNKNILEGENKHIKNRGNSTHKALIELDKIIMSLYMINYIDDVRIRKNVQRALNRGESYHQLKSAIVKTGSGKISGKTPLQLNISNECTAFIASIIIYYNASILTQLLEGYKSKKDNKNTKLIMRLSPVAWQHVNLLGYYEFCRNGQPVNIEAIIQLLMDNSKINFALQTVE